MSSSHDRFRTYLWAMRTGVGFSKLTSMTDTASEAIFEVESRRRNLQFCLAPQKAPAGPTGLHVRMRSDLDDL